MAFTFYYFTPIASLSSLIAQLILVVMWLLYNAAYYLGFSVNLLSPQHLRHTVFPGGGKVIQWPRILFRPPYGEHILTNKVILADFETSWNDLYCCALALFLNFSIRSSICHCLFLSTISELGRGVADGMDLAPTTFATLGEENFFHFNNLHLTRNTNYWKI